MEIPRGEWVAKTIVFKEKYGTRLEFPEGVGRGEEGDANQKTLHREGEGIDYFWNRTRCPANTCKGLQLHGESIMSSHPTCLWSDKQYALGIAMGIIRQSVDIKRPHSPSKCPLYILRLSLSLLTYLYLMRSSQNNEPVWRPLTHWISTAPSWIPTVTQYKVDSAVTGCLQL